MKKLAIFDLDGTLLNTIHDLGQAANHTLSLHGFPTHHISSYPHFVGNGISKLIERVLPAENRDEETISTLRRDFVEYYNEHLTDHTAPYPGIEQLLVDLHQSGIELAVASNKYQQAAETLIRHFFPQVPWVAICGHTEGMPTKPDPSVIFSILLSHPTAKSSTVMIGDSGVDVETARRAAIESVAVTWGFAREDEILSHFPDHIANTPGQVRQLILE